MTTLLERAISQLRTLSDDEQDAIASPVLISISYLLELILTNFLKNDDRNYLELRTT